jgi:hypothetical protein
MLKHLAAKNHVEAVVGEWQLRQVSLHIPDPIHSAWLERVQIQAGHRCEALSQETGIKTISCARIEYALVSRWRQSYQIGGSGALSFGFMSLVR